MIISTATLIKHSTEDGLVEIQDDIPLGKKYTVDLDTIRMVDGQHTKKKVMWKREVVDVKDGETWRWFPTELLSIWKET